MRKLVTTPHAPQAVGPYAQGMVAGGFVFCSGQLPLQPETGALPQAVEDQVRQSLDNLMAVLVAAGASASSILKTTVFLKDMNDFATMNAIYAGYFPSGAPARTTVEVARLPRDAKVEIEAIALVVPAADAP